MKPPIFLIEEGDVTAFDSTEAVESYVEPVDVLNNEYVFYDAEGRLLSAACFDNSVKLSPAESEPSHAELVVKLRNYLFQTQRQIADVDVEHELPALVEAFGEFVLDVSGRDHVRRTCLSSLWYPPNGLHWFSSLISKVFSKHK